MNKKANATSRRITTKGLPNWLKNEANVPPMLSNMQPNESNPLAQSTIAILVDVYPKKREVA